MTAPLPARYESEGGSCSGIATYRLLVYSALRALRDTCVYMCIAQLGPGLLSHSYPDRPLCEFIKSIYIAKVDCYAIVAGIRDASVYFWTRRWWLELGVQGLVGHQVGWDFRVTLPLHMGPWAPWAHGPHGPMGPMGGPMGPI